MSYDAARTLPVRSKRVTRHVAAVIFMRRKRKHRRDDTQEREMEDNLKPPSEEMTTMRDRPLCDFLPLPRAEPKR